MPSSENLPAGLPPRQRRRALLAATAAGAAWLLVAGPARVHPAAAAESVAEKFIAALGQRTVEALNQPGASQGDRARSMAPILDEAIDIDVIARLVLGRHWRAASEAQRREFIDLFRAYALDTLAQRFSYYTGSERFVIKGSRQAGDNDTLVNTQILYVGYPPTSVDWRVRQTGDRMMIVDVVAEGVSLLVTNRSEFDSIAGRSGVDGVLQELRARHAASPAGARPGSPA